MLPMNEQDKSERIERLLSTMNCAQKQLTHNDEWKARSTQIGGT